MKRYFGMLSLIMLGACGGSPLRPTPPPVPTTETPVVSSIPADPTPAPPAAEPTPAPQPTPAPPAPVPVPEPTPAPQIPPPAPQHSIPYYARVTNAYWHNGVAQFPNGFIVEWFPDRLEFGTIKFLDVVGPQGNEPGTVLAFIKDEHSQMVVRLSLSSPDGKNWGWSYESAEGVALGTLERR